jgi:chromosome segregation ATPase
MNFLSFFNELDNKRRRNKRIAINLLYALIPVVILAGSFTNDRIITECEDIHHYNTELQQEIIRLKKECNSTQREPGTDKQKLEEEISQLDRDRRLVREELAELERQRASIIAGNGTLAEEARRYREERDAARQENDRLEDKLTAAIEEGRRMRDRGNLCEQEKRELEAQLESGGTGSSRDRTTIDNLNNRLASLQRDYDELKENCNQGWEIKYNALQEENTDLRRRLDNCEGNNSRTSKDYVEFSLLRENALPTRLPATQTLAANRKYAVEVNGNVLTYICTGKCSN